VKKFVINKGFVCTSVALVVTGTVLGVVASNRWNAYENKKVTPEINTYFSEYYRFNLSFTDEFR
jgi:hypothetical protein